MKTMRGHENNGHAPEPPQENQVALDITNSATLHEWASSALANNHVDLFMQLIDIRYHLFHSKHNTKDVLYALFNLSKQVVVKQLVNNALQFAQPQDEEFQNRINRYIHNNAQEAELTQKSIPSMEDVIKNFFNEYSVYLTIVAPGVLSNYVEYYKKLAELEVNEIFSSSSTFSADTLISSYEQKLSTLDIDLKSKKETLDKKLVELGRQRQLWWTQKIGLPPAQAEKFGIPAANHNLLKNAEKLAGVMKTLTSPTHEDFILLSVAKDPKDEKMLDFLLGCGSDPRQETNNTFVNIASSAGHEINAQLHAGKSVHKILDKFVDSLEEFSRLHTLAIDIPRSLPCALLKAAEDYNKTATDSQKVTGNAIILECKKAILLPNATVAEVQIKAKLLSIISNREYGILNKARGLTQGSALLRKLNLALWSFKLQIIEDDTASNIAFKIVSTDDHPHLIAPAQDGPEACILL